jgi:DNA-binding MarR family transcriptional regulator
VSHAPALDRLIHERLRLGIVSALAVNESLSFGDLKKLLHTSDGNLSVHARKLEEAEYVACTKSFEGRLPRTEYRLTAAGRRALERYLDHMEALIRATREAWRALSGRPASAPGAAGWCAASPVSPAVDPTGRSRGAVR